MLNCVFAPRKCHSSSPFILKSSFSQEENNWLNDEANKVRAETVNHFAFNPFNTDERLSQAEYVQFMSKKTNLRQTQIVTLTDYHRQEIGEINQDKENMLKEYEKKKEGILLRDSTSMLFTSFV